MFTWILLLGVVFLCQSGLFAGFNSLNDILALVGLA